MLNRYFPVVVLVFAIVQGFAAIAFILKAPFAIDNWPMDGTSRLSFLFLASIFASGATGQLWCLARKQYGALVGVALDYITISGPTSIYLLSVGASRGDGELAGLGVLFLLTASFGVSLFLWSRRFAIRDPQPLPLPVRSSFGIFIVALVIVGGLMIFHITDVMSWRITDDGEVMYGLMFLGAAAYFVYGLLRPSWQNADGHLAAFLTYDLVLIWPFIRHFENVPDTLRPNHIIYTAVVAASGLLAIFYLFINPATRVWGISRNPAGVLTGK